MKRKLLAAVLIFAMLFSCVPTMALAEDAHNDHRICGASTCTHKGHDNAVTWTAWGTNGSAPTKEGNYYLTGNIELTEVWEPVGTTTLCLNGYTLEQKGDKTAAENNGTAIYKSVIKVNSSVTLNICDCGTTGTITGGTGTDASSYDEDGTIKFHEYLGGGIYNVGTLNLYGGTISGNTLGDVGDSCGGGVYNEGNFYFYDGTISNNVANCGAGVYNYKGNFIMYKGSISNNKYSTATDVETSPYESSIGGGVCNAPNSSFTMNGGTITGNSVERSGGGVWNNGTFEMNGGSIIGNSINNNNQISDNDVNGSVKVNGGTIGVANESHEVTYKVTVENGNSDGYYKKGSQVTIKADDSEEGKHFAGWTTNNGIQFIPNEMSVTASFTMPASAVTVTANYESHNFNVLQKDETDHWKECANCEAIDTKAAHTFEWVIDKPATTTETGLKHEKCTGCDATRNENTVSEKLPAGTSSSGGGFTGDYNYPVSIGDTDGADVVLSENYAIEGETVTITVNPNAGKQVDEVIVTDEDGEVITVSKVGDNQYIFTMPEGKVNVSVTTEDIAYDTKVVLQIGNNNVVADGRTITNDVAPIIQGDRTLVPIRVIVEALGGNVDWNEATRTVTIEIDGKVLTLVIDKMIPGFGQGATIINDRTYVPIRYIAEYIDAHVDWIAATQQIVILK